MGRGRAGYSRERHVGIVWTKVALLAMGLMMLGVYVAIRPEFLPEAVEPLVVEASGGLSAFEEEMRGGRHLLQSSDKVYITGHDDDKVVYNPETNPTGDLTCKSEGQVFPPTLLLHDCARVEKLHLQLTAELLFVLPVTATGGHLPRVRSRHVQKVGFGQRVGFDLRGLGPLISLRWDCDHLRRYLRKHPPP